MTESTTPKPKKQSLKDIARRVSTIPPTSEGKAPAPTLLDSMRPISVSTPPPTAPMKELAELCNAAASSAKTPPTRIEKEKKSRGTLASTWPIAGGIAVALGAIALSVVFVTRSSTQSKEAMAEPVAAAPLVQQSTTSSAKSTDEQKEKANQNTSESNSEDDPAGSTHSGETVKRDKGAEPPPVEAPKTDAKSDTKAEAKAEQNTGTDPKAEANETEPKGLSGAMAAAVGEPTTTSEPSEDKSSIETTNQGSSPITPSQGQVQSALASVRGAARGCVAGMEEPSRATLTFGSNGRVTNVSVGGAASGKPAESCIRSALNSARVPPFTNPSFTVGLTLRP